MNALLPIGPVLPGDASPAIVGLPARPTAARVAPGAPIAAVAHDVVGA